MAGNESAGTGVLPLSYRAFFFIVIQFTRYFSMGYCSMQLIVLIGCFPTGCVYSKSWKFLKKKKD